MIYLFSPIYRGGLTNHLPMMKKAMKALGFSDQRMNEVETFYIKDRGLENAEDSEFGRQFLQVRDSIDNISVVDYLKDKYNTFPSALFHCLIRLYYSLGNEEEIKSAMAYYELSGKEYRLDFPTTELPNRHMKQLIKARQNTKVVFDSPLTMDKYRAILRSPLESLFRVPEVINLEEIIDIFLDAFTRTRDFYILHVITGFQALLGLSDYLDMDKAVREYYKHAQVFIVLNTFFDDGLQRAEHKMDHYVRMASTLQDAHDIKLLHSLVELKKYTDSELIEDIAHFIIYGENS